MKLAFITPRYGGEIATGAEHACRLLAEQLSLKHDVEVLRDIAPAQPGMSQPLSRGVKRHDESHAPLHP